MSKKGLLIILCIIGFSMNSVCAIYDDSWGVLDLHTLNKRMYMAPNLDHQDHIAWKHRNSYFPDEAGNKRLGLWGHHTTHGSAFAGLENLKNGDHVTVEDWRDNKNYDYYVYNTFIEYNQGASIDFNYPDHELYLATCYAPEGSTAELVKGLHPC
ncbi:MAG: sortase [Methanobrevibacter sp.]|nr:sortase [Methanobrevibacter sp.]